MKVILFLVLFCVFVVGNTQTDTTVTVHIIHGSVPKEEFKDQEYKMLGGMMGGHVVMQVDDSIYGFAFSKWELHLFPKRKKSIGSFHTSAFSQWWELEMKTKLTSIVIPVTKQQHDSILHMYRRNLKNSPYDYAFFGTRCAASCYKMLADAGVFPRASLRKSRWIAFYPRPLKRKLTKKARKKGWNWTVREGSYTRRWEK